MDDGLIAQDAERRHGYFRGAQVHWASALRTVTALHCA